MGAMNGLPNTTPGSAPGSSDPYLREQLLERRRRLHVPGLAGREDVRALIHDVDLALERLETGAFGLCEECHVPLEAERLVADPLTRVCLECLDADQARALERDLELASSVQAALLPAAAIEIDGYRIRYDYPSLSLHHQPRGRLLTSDTALRRMSRSIPFQRIPLHLPAGRTGSLDQRLSQTLACRRVL